MTTTANSENQMEIECCICFETKLQSKISLFHCSHCVTCNECFEKLIINKCPICRSHSKKTPIDEIILIYGHEPLPILDKEGDVIIEKYYDGLEWTLFDHKYAIKRLLQFKRAGKTLLQTTSFLDLLDKKVKENYLKILQFINKKEEENNLTT